MADNLSSNLPALTILGGDKAGVRFVLEEPVDNVLLGSDPSCRFCIELPGVSPVHARIWIDDTGITVYDTNSPRGLYVNDERIGTQVRLRNGDVIWLGPPGDEQSVMIQCRIPTKDARPEPEAAQTGTDVPSATPAVTTPLAVPEGGFSLEAETVAVPPADALSTPLPPPASLLPPPAPPARNEFEDDMAEGTVPMPQVPTTHPPMATPTPTPSPGLAHPRSPKPASHTPPAMTMTPAPARPASLTPVPRPAGRPGAAHRPASPAHAPAHAPQPRRARGKGLAILAIGLAALLLLGAASAGVWYFWREPLSRLVSAKPSPSVIATPPPVAPRPMAETPVAETTPTATPAAAATTALPTPIEVVIPVKSSTPSPAATPVKTPTPTKTPTPGKTPSPAAAASAEALRAQQQAAQVAALVAQAESAYSSQRFDAALGFYDEALRVDPRDAQAAAGKQAATAAAFCWKRAFVPGRTNVQAAKGGGGSSLQGFESADVKVARAPDYSGLIEFVVTPAHVKPGDSYSVRVNLTNDGKKAFRLASATVALVVNGERTPVPTTAPAGDLAAHQSGTLAQMGGSWLESTRSWTVEVSVATAHGDAFSNQLGWR